MMTAPGSAAEPGAKNEEAEKSAMDAFWDVGRSHSTAAIPVQGVSEGGGSVSATRSGRSSTKCTFRACERDRLVQQRGSAAELLHVLGPRRHQADLHLGVVIGHDVTELVLQERVAEALQRLAGEFLRPLHPAGERGH